MIKTTRIALLMLVAIILSSCSNTAKQVMVATPTAGKANVSGRIVSINTGKPYIDATVRLAEVYRNELGEGAYALDAALSPQTVTDDQGNFVFTDIDPRAYVLIIGDPMTRYVIVADETGKAIVYSCLVDQVTNLGEHKIDFDAP